MWLRFPERVAAPHETAHISSALDLTPTQLKLLEPVQGGFHPLPMSVGRPPSDPVPALHQKLLPLPVGLEVEGGHDPIPDEMVDELCRILQRMLTKE